MKKLLIGLIAVVFAFPVYAADMDVYVSLNYMITNSDDSSGNRILKAENNGSKIGIDFSETLSFNDVISLISFLIMIIKFSGSNIESLVFIMIFFI